MVKLSAFSDRLHGLSETRAGGFSLYSPRLLSEGDPPKRDALLRFESEPGKGTELWIEIPLRQENRPAVSKSESVM
ncbi:ATP-binding protein [Calothrix sp. PCC 7507]|uniref:ATP-binding protein n=1 Tax=Calothrix sp. PCC 7507 TaxID=99598 RepID=UPI0005A7848E|nr:ATP-binding protein [Calothrix sp. PCC 7507]